MKKDFLWSDIELQNPELDAGVEEILKGFGLDLSEFTPEELASMVTIDEMDITIVEGYCQKCGEPFSWSGLMKDMPDDFCDCSKRR